MSGAFIEHTHKCSSGYDNPLADADAGNNSLANLFVTVGSTDTKKPSRFHRRQYKRVVLLRVRLVVWLDVLLHDFPPLPQA